MDTKEKLERAAIVKEKGTVYFKVREFSTVLPSQRFAQMSANLADSPFSEFYQYPSR